MHLTRISLPSCATPQSNAWLAFTVLSLPLFLVSVALLVMMVPFAIFATIRSTQALYLAKVVLAERHEAAEKETTDVASLS